MNRIGSALGWGVIGLVAGALIGAAAGLVLGVIRIENVAQAALAGAIPVGLIGALGAFAGRLLEKTADGSDNLTVVTCFFGALVGALTGATIGKALGADRWLLESVYQVEGAGSQAFLLYHIDLVGGPHVVVGALLGILAFGSLDVLLGSESSFTALVIAAMLTPVVAIIAALIGQIDWGTGLVIVIATVTILYIMMKSGGGASAPAGSGGSAKGKPKA